MSFQLKIDEELGLTLIWIALKARGKMAYESQPRLIDDGICGRCSHFVLRNLISKVS